MKTRTASIIESIVGIHTHLDGVATAMVGKVVDEKCSMIKSQNHRISSVDFPKLTCKIKRVP
jgi:hypothetical protein